MAERHYKSGLSLKMGMMSTSVSLDSAVIKPEGFKTVCVGADPEHKHEPTPIRQTEACPGCENDDKSTFQKARIVGDQYQPVTADELRAVRQDPEVVAYAKRDLDITVHPATEVRDSMASGGKVYALVPSSQPFATTYGNIVDLIRRHPEYAFLTMWTPSSVTAVFEVVVYRDNTLLLVERVPAEALRVTEQPAYEVPDLNRQQLDILLSLGVTPFDPSAYEDKRAKAINALLATKEAVTGVATRSGSGSKVAAVTEVDLSAQLAAALASAGLEVPAKKTKKSKSKKHHKEAA